MNNPLETLIAGLKLAIKGATPGQWSFARSGANVNVQAPVTLQRGGAARVILCSLKSAQWRGQLATAHDAAFIALANPENIAVLIAALEARQLAVKLPDRKADVFWPGDASEFDSPGYEMAVREAIRAAGGHDA